MSIHADILDMGALSILSVLDIELYLVKNGWNKIKQVAGSIIFDRKDGAEKSRIWLPVGNDLEESFLLDLKKVIRTISIIEGRSQLDVLEDFDSFSIGDILRYQTRDPLASKRSSLPFDYGINAIEQAKNLLLAGASFEASSKKKAFYGSHKPQAATDYSRSLRLGQTERGSYVVKIISPIPTSLREQGTLPGIPESTPFERRAIGAALSGATALREVALQVHKRGVFHIEPFYERIEEGLTAELCEAIVGKNHDNHSQVDISVTWTPSFKVTSPLGIPEHLEFPVHLFHYISEAARIFKTREPEKILITGYVVKLHKEKPIGTGDITVAAVIKSGELEGRGRRITIELNKTDYTTATKAHERWQEIECYGTLENKRLSDISQFSIIGGRYDEQE